MNDPQLQAERSFSFSPNTSVPLLQHFPFTFLFMEFYP